jgi:hypothetical protein
MVVCTAATVFAGFSVFYHRRWFSPLWAVYADCEKVLQLESTILIERAAAYTTFHDLVNDVCCPSYVIRDLFRICLPGYTRSL